MFCPIATHVVVTDNLADATVEWNGTVGLDVGVRAGNYASAESCAKIMLLLENYLKSCIERETVLESFEHNGNTQKCLQNSIGCEVVEIMNQSLKIVRNKAYDYAQLEYQWKSVIGQE